MSKKEVDYSEVIRTIEHHLQYGSGSWPYESHEDTAQHLSDGDAWRALIEIGRALDRTKT